METVKKSELTRGRLIATAIELFGSRPFEDVSITDIANASGLVPQGVYRYFKNKNELFFCALERDIDLLHSELLQQIRNRPLASLTGEIWYLYAALAKEHQLAQAVIPQRESRVLDFLSQLDSTKTFRAVLLSDLLAGQTNGIVRNDIDLERTMDSIQYLVTHLLLPLLFEDKYMSTEWQQVSNVLLAIGFYPVPDLSSPEKVREFEIRIEKLVEKMSDSKDSV